MSNKNPRVDAYIDKAAAFAQTILNHLRELVHRACPGIEETLKWGMPAFEYRGLLGGMAAFKNHATFSLWKHELVLGQKAAKHALGQFGRLTSLQDLPPDKILLGYIRIAAKLNEAGIKAPSGNRARPGARRDLVVPDFFVVALKNNKKARDNFAQFSYSHKKEYVEWLTDAKREATRRKRLETCLAWIADGKPQNGKYKGC